MQTYRSRCVSVCALLVAVGCASEPSSKSTPSPTEGASVVMLSVTSDAQQEPLLVNMAMKLAGFAVDEGRHVVMFFNVHGAKVPSSHLADDFASQDDKPIKAQLAELIERGVDVHVCPICMEALDVSKADLMEGAKVTTRASLFANIGANTTVFTY